MKSLQTLPLFALVALLAVAAAPASEPLKPSSPEKVGFSSERLERLDTALAEYVDQERLPGTTVLLARKGKIAHLSSYGYANLESKTPIQDDTIFRIASQTKALTSVSIMILQEQGKLLIKDNLSKYFPEFDKPQVAEKTEDGYKLIPAKRPITLRHLLTHTSGFGYGGGPAKDLWKNAGITGWYFADRDEPIQSVVERMGALPLESHPGERFVYGYSSDILGAVIERVSGMTLSDFFQKEILDPLGMKDTHFFLPKNKTDRLATVYSNNPDAPIKVAPEKGAMMGQGQYVNGPRKCYSGGAGLLSTAKDYATFLQMMLNGGEYNGHRILSRKTVELMTVSHIGHIPSFKTSRPGQGFGLGFSVIEDLGQFGELGSLGEFGWGGAYHSKYWVDPAQGLVVVYFTQVRPGGGLDDHSKLRSLIYQAITD